MSDAAAPTGGNPLDEAIPQSLDILFNTDPLELTEAQRLQIVTELRAHRARAEAAFAAGKTRAPTPKAKAVPQGDINLADLGLG